MPESPAVVAWRQFRNRMGPLFPLLDELDAWGTLRERDFVTPEVARRVRPLVPAPSFVVERQLNSIANAMARETTGSMQPLTHLANQLREAQRSDPKLRRLADVFCAWMAWRTEKRIYRLTPELAGGLRRAQWPATYPVSHFHLPASAIVIEIPPDATNSRFGAMSLLLHYDMHRPRVKEGGLVIKVSLVPPLGEPVRAGFPILPSIFSVVSTDETLGSPNERFRKAIDAATAVGDTSPEERAWWVQVRTAIHLAINTVLYLANDDDTVRAAGHGVAPSAAARRRDSGPAAVVDRAHDLKPPLLFDVGVRYAGLIQRYERDLAAAAPAVCGPMGQTGRRMRPHLRGAHTHLYWTGPGRTTPRVHFLPPIPVHGGATSEAARPSVRDAR